MDGAVILGGGGTPDDEREVWHCAYSGVQRVLYWPFALSGSILDTAESWFRDALASLGLAAEVTTWTGLEDRDGADLAGFDLLHVGGGNTFRLLDELQRYDFLDPVRKYVRESGRYYGGSAGAVAACSDIEIATGHDRNDVGLADLRALDLVPIYAVLPHHDPTAGSARPTVGVRSRPVLGIPERGGIRYCDGTFTVIGPDSSTEFGDSGVTVRAVGTSWSVPG